MARTTQTTAYNPITMHPELPGVHYEEDGGAGSGAPAAAAEGEEALPEGATVVEYVRDPDTGRMIRSADVFAMRSEANRKYGEASRLVTQAQEREERVMGVLERIESNRQPAAAPSGAPAVPEVVDLRDIVALDDEGIRELGSKMNLGLNATRTQIVEYVEQRNKALRADVRKDTEGVVDSKLLERDVHADNVSTARDYFAANQVPKKVHAEVLEVLKRLPRTSDNGSPDPQNPRLWRYSEAAMRRADYAVRGDELVQSAEARGRQAGYEQYRTQMQTRDGVDIGGGVGSVSLKGKSTDDIVTDLEGMSSDIDRLMALDTLSDEELYHLPSNGFQAQMASMNRGRVPPINRR